MHSLLSRLRKNIIEQSNHREEARDDEEDCTAAPIESVEEARDDEDDCTVVTTESIEESPRTKDPADVQKINENDLYVTIDKVNWTELVQSGLPEEQQCKISNCPIAPTPHEKHYHCFNRSYAFIEEKYILKYLINTNTVKKAKGLKVYGMMHEDGYLTNRTVMSLQNHFIKHMLPKIEFYQLPENVEPRFLDLRC